MSELRLGLLGAGRIGRIHAEAIATRVLGAHVTTVFDVVDDAATACAADHDIPAVAATAEDVLADADVDAVLICTSTDTHAPLIEAAAQAGKAIFCEKPISMDLAAIDLALAAVDAAGVPLQIGFNRRFDLGFARARDAVAAGDIGRPELLRITSFDPEPPPVSYIEVSGGIFLDMMIHDFDMARFLLDDEIVEVSAAGAVLVDPAIGGAGDVDTAVVTCTFASGAIGVIQNSRRAVYGYDQRVEVFGADGMVEVPNAVVDPVVRVGADGARQAPGFPDFRLRYADSYVVEMQAFVDAVVAGTPTPVVGADGRAPCVAGLAAQRSLDEHRPVTLAEVEASPAGPAA